MRAAYKNVANKIDIILITSEELDTKLGYAEEPEGVWKKLFTME